MRKLLSLSIVASMLLFGCSKEPSTSVAPKAVENGGKTITLQLIDATTMRPVGDKIKVSVDEMRKHIPRVSSSSAKESNSVSATGYFTLAGGLYHHSLSAIENNGGTHGQNNIWIPNASMNLTTKCMAVNGNEATWSAIVTNSTWYPVNYYLWWRVRDNGEGANDPVDQISNYYIYYETDPETGEPFDFCSTYGGDMFFAWDDLFENEFKVIWSWIDVDEGGNIQVND